MADRTTHAIGPRRLLLIGMMGSGKSTLGRALEQRLGWPYLDNDRILEAATGSSARELLAAGGERALRTGEGAALRYACATRPPAIAGIAAGTILDGELRRELEAAGDVVWLRGRPEVLARRALASGRHAAPGRHRPWLTRGPESTAGWFAAEDTRRAPLYASVADLVVDVATPHGGDRPVDELVEQILLWLARPAVARRAPGDGYLPAPDVPPSADR